VAAFEGRLWGLEEEGVDLAIQDASVVWLAATAPPHGLCHQPFQIQLVCVKTEQGGSYVG